jgi:internalin A
MMVNRQRLAVVFVHGLFSSTDVWSSFAELIRADSDLSMLTLLRFPYSSPVARVKPTRRIPNFNDISDSLGTYLDVEAAGYDGLILVSHSQGGLIVQRYLARMLSDGRGHDLARILRIVLFACPNSGAQFALLLRKAMGWWRHPQERELRPINESITETQRTVINRIIYARENTTNTCRITLFSYAGESDNIVTPASAKSVFPGTGVIPGDHSSIIRPDSHTHRSYTTLKSNLLAAVQDFSSEHNSELDTKPIARYPAGISNRGSVAQTALDGLPRRGTCVGRIAELGNLAGLLDERQSTTAIISIAGLAGAGKTTLALDAAHSARESGLFPGGALFLDLQGYDPHSRLEPIEALAVLLQALGVPEKFVPPILANCVLLYRKILWELATDRRSVLLVLDNALSADQIRPLLPGSGPHKVIATSRHTLNTLDGAHLMEIGSLDSSGAIILMKQVLHTTDPADSRLDTEPDAARKVANLCGNLPLALRIAVALLASNRKWPVSGLLEVLSVEKSRLTTLQVGGDRNVRVAFDLSYRQLDPPQDRLFRLLGLNPSPQISLGAAAALADMPELDTRQALEELCRAHLLEHTRQHDRYMLHDLLRLYAVERVDHIENAASRASAISRLLDHYCEIIRIVGPHLHLQPDAPAPSQRFTSKKEVMAWLDANHQDLVEAMALAQQADRHSDAQEFAGILGRYFSSPPEIVASGSAAIIEFIRSYQSGTVAQWVSKLHVIGEGGVGKTTLVKVLTGEPINFAEPSTHGLRIGHITVPHPDQPTVQIRLNAWDFGGQQIYHATHQFFMTDRSPFLVLWNCRLGWENSRLRYWLDVTTARAPRAPILLVATHADERPVDLPFAELREEYPQIVDSVAVDSRTGNGFSLLIQKIIECAIGLPSMGSQWPRLWLTAAEAMRNSADKYMTTQQMWQAMADAGVTDPTQQRYVATALHELGDILYFADDPELSQVVILSPEWANEYFSKVLESDQVAANLGILTRAEIGRLWPDLDPGLRAHFLSMMDKYDLSYRIDGESVSAVSLVVERLPWNPPEYKSVWDEIGGDKEAHEIKVLYRLNSMPPGIPTWFIARSHRFSTGTQWRTGALLRHGAHLALVRSDQHRRTVELTVRGPAPAAFFSILDDGLNRILERFPGLDIERQVPCTCETSCTELYNYEDLSRRLMRTPPRHEIECRRTGKLVHVPSLLLGLAPSSRDIAGLGIENIGKILTRLDDRLDEQAEYNQRMFLRLQHIAQQQQEARCPSIFAVVSRNSPATGEIACHLHFYCEEPGAWHRLQGTNGCYQIAHSAKFLATFEPYLQSLLKVFKHATPLAKPVLGMPVDKIDQKRKDDYAQMSSLLAHGVNYISPESEHDSVTVEHESDFRALEGILTTLDPDRSWGGLARTITPEGLTLYLCRDHADAYRRDAY